MYLLFSFTIGGTERLVADICNEMAERQHEVHLYVVNDLYSEKILDSIDGRIHLILQNRQTGNGDKFSTMYRIAKYIRSNRIEVVHCNSLNAPELLALKPLIYRETKIIHTIHDVGQYAVLPKWKIKLRNIICNHFVAISESVKNDIITHGAKPDKIVTIYNAINLKKFRSTNLKVFDPNCIVIGNVARLMPEKKGQDILIKAIVEVKKKYPGVICYFAGGYDNNHKASLEELQCMVEKYDAKKNIVFLGNVDNVPRFLEAIDIFVLPSRFEGFGISLIEAIAMGIPCISSNLDGPAEIIGNEERGLLFNSGDSYDLAKKIMNTIDNYQRIKEDCDRRIAYIHEHFDINVMCNQLELVYKS